MAITQIVCCVQAMLCNHTVGVDGCAALSFCRTMGDSCVPKLYAQDSFGSTVQEYLVSGGVKL